MPTPGQLVATIKSAATKATAVHIKGSFADNGVAESLDVQLNKDGTASGTVGESGALIPVIVADKVYYIQFTKDLMTASNINPTSDLGRSLLDKWVPSTAKMLSGSSMVSGLKQAMDFNTLVPGLFGQLGGDTPAESGTTTVNGVPAHVYTYPDNSSADVATAAPHYLVRIAESASQGNGSLDFTGWDKPVAVSAPAAQDIYSGT
jgi:hypothetical protein